MKIFTIVFKKFPSATNQTINPFHTTRLFLYPLKTSENLWFFEVFRMYGNRPVTWNGLRDCKTEKPSYKSIAIFSNLSKIDKQIFHDQMHIDFNYFFPNNQWGFCNGNNTQHWLLAITEKVKKARDSNKVSEVCTVILPNLPHAFGFDYKSVRVVHA